ncbi:MAG: DNA polymerase III subunit beta [Myxococcota bacterium]
MELSIQKRELFRGLQRTHGVADRKSSMPILSNVLLTTESNDVLRLAATDLYLGVTSTVAASVNQPGSIAVAARTLYDIVRALPEGEITLEVGQNQAVAIRSGRIRYSIPGLPGEDFPPLPNPDGVDMTGLGAAALHELIALTSYSMSTDDTRPHLAGTLFEGEGEMLRMVTTDGHRLSKAEAKAAEGAALAFKMLVPHKGIGELKKLLDDLKSAKTPDGPVKVEVGTDAAGNAFFRSPDVQLSVKLADEQFPPYSKVIPQQQDKRVVADRGRLVDSLKRISLVTSDKSGGVTLQIEDGLVRIKSQSSDVGEGIEEVEVDYAGEGVAIGFNAKYLLDALGALPQDEVALELSGTLDPGVVKPVGEGADFVGVIMPMRI